MSRSLLIRADGSEHMGTGHVMRCLALAQAWQDARGPVYWLAHALTPALESRLKSEGIHLLPYLQDSPGSPGDAAAVADAARKWEASWTVIDSYDFLGAYQEQLRTLGIRHLAFDDNGHAGYYCANLVLNGNFHAQETLYHKRHASTRLLLGCRYAPLRREILSARPQTEGRSHADPPRLLVTFGGSDPQNMTLRALETLTHLSPPRPACTVVVGGSNPHLGTLMDYLKTYPDTIDLQVNAADMGRLMAASDLAFMAGGSSVLEALYLGLPMVIATIADNQIQLAEKLRDAGLAILAGHGTSVSTHSMTAALVKLLNDSKLRNAMANAARACVDGKGVARILEIMDT